MSGESILIVEANPSTRAMLRVALETDGYAVVEAADARAALTAAQHSLPDLVLQDLDLPDMDGLELVRLLRGLAGPALPILVLSGFLGGLEKSGTVEAGFTALLVKPIEPRRLVEAVRTYLTDAATLTAGETGSPPVAQTPSETRQLEHARRQIQDLERQIAVNAGLAQRCGFQAAQLMLLSWVADALTHQTDFDAALRNVLAATFDAAGISKGALILRDEAGALRVRQAIGFSDAERASLQAFFGHPALFEDIVGRGASVSVPSAAVPDAAARAILTGGGVTSAQIVSLMSDRRGVGAVIVAASHADVTSDDSIAFARAMGNQVVQSLELSRSVARLTISEERYRTLLESANDFIAVLTPDGFVRQMNRRWVEALGVPHEQLVGRHIREFAPAPAEHENLRTIARPDGSTILIEVSSTVIELGGERLVLKVGRDVTEQRLLEDQLRQAQKLEAIGRLAGGVAHDFNNVLTAILGFSELLMDEIAADTQAHADVLEIKKAVDRAAGLTQQLLAFSRQQFLQPRVLDMNALIVGMEPMLRRLTLEHIDLVVSLTPAAGMIKIDPTKLEQILVNLVVNAADAMPRGGRLTIETAKAPPDATPAQRPLPVPPGDYAMLAVSDTGIGMDQATTRRIFEPFFTTKEVGKGTGLGLATVYGIVKQSGGDILVDSEPGRGTTFRIYLPQVTAAVPDSPAPSLVPPEIPRGSETIFVVEDDEQVRVLVRLTLERAGYRVLEAGNPKEAVRVALEFDGRIDLLLSDVIMPESEGPPLFGRLASERPGLRVLYTSGYSDEAIVRHGFRIEGMPFLQKPFSPHALARKVRDTLDAPPPTNAESA